MLLTKLKKFINSIFSADLFNTYDSMLYYLCGNEALPNPLDIEEEMALVQELKNNNELAKQKLIEHNLRLVVYIAKKFENTMVDLEDLISIGAIGLIKAVQSFDYEKNIKLATFASRCIENEILMYLRKTVKYKGEISIDEPLNADGDGNELMLSDVLYSENDTVSKDLESNMEKQLLWQCIENLNSREKEIMSLRYGLRGKEEKTQKEVADMLNISQSYISRLEKKILDRLKKDLKKVE